MRSNPKLRYQFEEGRPAGTSRKANKTLFTIFLALREALHQIQESLNSDALFLEEDEVDTLAIALVEMGEDLHSDAGIWQSLESQQIELLGTPLPLIWRKGDSPLDTFDPRRFQFYLYTYVGILYPDTMISHLDPDLLKSADVTSKILTDAFRNLPPASDVATFLSSPNTFAWDIKRKLIWLGTKSYLFRLLFEVEVLAEIMEPAKVEDIDLFICETCTEWSGLGVTDILAGALDISDEDQADLRNWNERHEAVYQVLSSKKNAGVTETLELLNVISTSPYHLRVNMKNCPFSPKKWIYGSLVPWRNEWYWSGEQRLIDPTAPEDIQKLFKEDKSGMVYRYCPDLLEKALSFHKQHQADFIKYYGSDLVFFPDGLELAASEQKRLRDDFIARAGANLDEAMKKHNLSQPGPKIELSREFLDFKEGVAAFFEPVEGVEYLAGSTRIITALRQRDKPLSEDQVDMLLSFLKDNVVSVEYIRRLIAEHGADAFGKVFLIADFQENPDLEYLLRRFKGSYFRRRYPNMSLTD